MEQDPPFSPALKRPGQGPLGQYRLYFIDRLDGHFAGSHEFEAEDDPRAIQIAQAWLEGRTAELWSGSRKVKRWEGTR